MQKLKKFKIALFFKYYREFIVFLILAMLSSIGFVGYFTFSSNFHIIHSIVFVLSIPVIVNYFHFIVQKMDCSREEYHLKLMKEEENLLNDFLNSIENECFFVFFENTNFQSKILKNSKYFILKTENVKNKEHCIKVVKFIAKKSKINDYDLIQILKKNNSKNLLNFLKLNDNLNAF